MTPARAAIRGSAWLCLVLAACVPATQTLEDPWHDAALDAGGDASRDRDGGMPFDASLDGSVEWEAGACLCGASGCQDAGCLACTENAHCGESDPVCKGSVCIGCTSTAECASRTAAPVCEVATGDCVQCTYTHQQLCTARGEVCLTDDSECVQCNTDDDCPALDKSRCHAPTHTCKACTDDSQCSDANGNPVCFNGTCVPCISGKTAACGLNVCDLTGPERKCSDQKRASSNVCEPCVSDEQCKTGQICVHMRWDSDENGSRETDVGWFCQWVPEGGGSAPLSCDSASRPYYNYESVTSADKPDILRPICTLATSTCPAQYAHRSPCGRVGTGAGSYLVYSARVDANGILLTPGLVVTNIHPDDSVCGLSGKCVPRNKDDGSYLCSMRCTGSTAVDCPAGPFVCGGTPPGIPRICAF